MSDTIKFIDNLLDTFDKDIQITNVTKDNDIKSKQNATYNPSAKFKNGSIHINTTSSSSSSSDKNNQSDKPKTPPPKIIIEEEEEKEVLNDEIDELSEEEALRLQWKCQ